MVAGYYACSLEFCVSLAQFRIISFHCFSTIIAPTSKAPHSHLTHPNLPSSSKTTFSSPATFNTSHVYRPFNLPIPLRSRSILISLYLLRNLLFMCLDCHLFSVNLYWPAEETSNSHDTWQIVPGFWHSLKFPFSSLLRDKMLS